MLTFDPRPSLPSGPITLHYLLIMTPVASFSDPRHLSQHSLITLSPAARHQISYTINIFYLRYFDVITLRLLFHRSAFVSVFLSGCAAPAAVFFLAARLLKLVKL